MVHKQQISVTIIGDGTQESEVSNVLPGYIQLQMGSMK